MPSLYLKALGVKIFNKVGKKTKSRCYVSVSTMSLYAIYRNLNR